MTALKYEELIKTMRVCANGLCAPNTCKRFYAHEEGEMLCEEDLLKDGANALNALLRQHKDLYFDLRERLGALQTYKFCDGAPKMVELDDVLAELFQVFFPNDWMKEGE